MAWGLGLCAWWLRGAFLGKKSPLAGRTRRLQFMALEAREMLSGYHFDFVASAAARAPEYKAVLPVAYEASRGYGWSDLADLSALDRKSFDKLNSDFHTGADSTFHLDVPNGTYQVNVSLGDSNALRDNVDVYLNGGKVASGLTTQAGEFVKPAYRVTVTDGQLKLRLVDRGGLMNGWAIGALDVLQTDGPIASTGANFSVNEASSVTFAGFAEGNGPLKYLWRFGDGTTETGTLTPKHTYADSGTYKVSLSVFDAEGNSTRCYATVTVKNTNPRPNALGPYSGLVNQPVPFVALAKDASIVDQEAGFTYHWSFGDGTSATGATLEHVYRNEGTYKVTLTVTDKDGGARSVSTTADIRSGTATSSPTEYQTLSANLLANTVYGFLNQSELAISGAWGANAKWEQGTASEWHIELQHYGEDLIIGGLLHADTEAIEAGLRAFDWGFAQQAADGSFAGTADAFHSTSLFIEAVANASLVLRQSPLAAQYQSKLDAYSEKLYRATQWMTDASVWAKGIKNNSPYTHRYYLVANALAMTSILVGGDSKLMSLARDQIQAGLAAQWSNGVNPELGGYDSSYQTLGISFATRWLIYFPEDNLTPAVKEMISKGLAWAETMILSNGEIDTEGCVRTGVETGPSSTIKTVDWKRAVDAFAFWYQLEGDDRWQANAQKIAQYYYKQY